jgi:hypothetical protein
MEPTLATLPSEPRRAKFEVRPSPLREWNADAPDEIVFTDGKKRGFGDLLQAINPLHHLPIVGTLYREMTGATIEPAARVIGGLVFGGPIGIASALVNAFVEESSGKDVGGHIAAMVKPAGSVPNLPPPPNAPMNAPGEGGLFLASARPMGQGGVEADGLLTTWIAGGAPMAEPLLEARASAPAPTAGPAMPTHLALYGTPTRPADASPTPLQAATPAPVAAPAAAPAAAPIVAMATAQMPEPASPPAPAPTGPEFLPTGVRGRSLAEYRASAQAIPTGAMRMPVPTDPLAFQRGAPRTLASYRADAPAAAPALPAAIEAQRQADGTAPGAEQSWVAAMMEAGLNRYRDAQRQRDAARPTQERL